MFSHGLGCYGSFASFFVMFAEDEEPVYRPGPLSRRHLRLARPASVRALYFTAAAMAVAAVEVVAPPASALVSSCGGGSSRWEPSYSAPALVSFPYDRLGPDGPIDIR